MKHRDPVCGMEIEESKAAGRSEYGGATYYFCSLQCRERFERNPQQYVRGGDARPEAR